MPFVHRATTRQELRTVHYAIHDLPFDVDRVHMDVPGTLVIPFCAPRWDAEEECHERGEDVDWELRILRVRDYRLVESEFINRYPFNVLKFVEPDRVEVVTDIPLVFYAHVEGLDVEVAQVTE